MFTKKVLEKYDVSYFQCSSCGFIQTEKPYWQEESYSNPITSLDVGLVNRNIQFSDVIEKIIYQYFDKRGKFLDFAGGYGLLTRIMRDKGFDFYREDKYCENLFAKHFDIDDLPEKERKFELITAFELMEHIENPFKELDYIFSMTDSFLFSTELIPDKNIENWWYIGTEHGQHISFYSKKALQIIAKRFNKVYYPCGNLHLLASKKGVKFCQKVPKLIKLIRIVKESAGSTKKMPSKIWSDFEYVVKKEKNNA